MRDIIDFIKGIGAGVKASLKGIKPSFFEFSKYTIPAVAFLGLAFGFFASGSTILLSTLIDFTLIGAVAGAGLSTLPGIITGPLETAMNYGLDKMEVKNYKKHNLEHEYKPKFPTVSKAFKLGYAFTAAAIIASAGYGGYKIKDSLGIDKQSPTVKNVTTNSPKL